MDSYIVRVYRKSLDNKQEVAGLIERVGADQQKTFQDMASLQSVLEAFIGTENIDTPETTRMDMTANERIAVNA